MEYHNYFELFLVIEDRLGGYLRQLEFNQKTESLYSGSISLLLLQTCPVIESYMVHLSTRSERVLDHPLYIWKGANRLWESKNGTIKERSGVRLIDGFSKFSYVIQNVFKLSAMRCRFYYSEDFQKLPGVDHFNDIKPFQTLKSFVDYQQFELEKGKQFPVGLETPKWWTAYNKIKHDMD